MIRGAFFRRIKGDGPDAAEQQDYQQTNGERAQSPLPFCDLSPFPLGENCNQSPLPLGEG